MIIVKSVHLYRCYPYDLKGAFELLEAKAYVMLTERNGSSTHGLIKVGVVERIPCSL